MVKVINRIIQRLFLRKINGVVFNTRKVIVRSWGKIGSNGYARIGFGSYETSDFFATKDASYFNNTGSIYLGEGASITGNFRILNKGLITIGNGSYINPNSVVRIESKLTIGDYCAISWNCSFMDTNHHKVNGTDIPEEIVIGNNVWIGANSILLKGCSVGNNSIVAAGSVVTKKFGDNLLIGGVPAKIIRENVKWEI